MPPGENSLNRKMPISNPKKNLCQDRLFVFQQLYTLTLLQLGSTIMNVRIEFYTRKAKIDLHFLSMQYIVLFRNSDYIDLQYFSNGQISRES